MCHVLRALLQGALSNTERFASTDAKGALNEDLLSDGSGQVWEFR